MKTIAKIVLALSGITGFIACCVKTKDYAISEKPSDLVWIIILFLGIISSFYFLRRLLK